MKISFKGVYLMSFADKSVRDKYYKSYNDKALNYMSKNNDCSIPPLTLLVDEKNMLVLTNNDAKDYYELEKFNKIPGYKDILAPRINNDALSKGLVNAYKSRALNIDLTNID